MAILHGGCSHLHSRIVHNQDSYFIYRYHHDVTFMNIATVPCGTYGVLAGAAHHTLCRVTSRYIHDAYTYNHTCLAHTTHTRTHARAHTHTHTQSPTCAK